MLERQQANLVRIGNSPISQYALLLGLTVFAAALRLYKLGAWNFWVDEMFTLRDVGEFWTISLARQQFSRTLIYLATSVLGTSEWSARIMPALIGVATIPVLFFPVKRIFGPAVALLAGLLLAVSTWHLYWSQNARFYTALLLFYTLALLALYFGIEKDRPLYLVLFLFFLGLATLERLFAVFLVPVAAGYLVLLYVLPFQRPPGLRLRNLMLLIVPGLVVAAIIGWEFVSQPGRWMQINNWVNNNPFWILGGVVYYVSIPIMCMGAAGGAYLLARRSRIGLLLSLSALVPLVSVLVLSLIQYTANRYVFPTLTSWIILAAVALWELLARNVGANRWLAVGAVALLVLQPMGDNLMYYRYQNGNRDNWRAAFDLIREHQQPGDAVVVDNVALGNYYIDEGIVDMHDLEPEDVPALGKRVWFVEDINAAERRSPALIDWIHKNTRLEGNFDVKVQARDFVMRVYLYESPSQIDSLASNRGLDD